MQNGRNRIAANGRTKTGKTTRRAKAPLSKAPVAFPAEVAVAAPPGQSTPKSFPAKSPKPRPARRKSAHPVKQRRPGRKKRAAAREAEHRRQTALVIVAAVPKAAKPPRHPETPEVICLADASQPETVAALPLPPQPEPLVIAAEPVARHHALARPSRSLVAAIAAWLGSTRRLLALNLLPRKARKPLPKPPRSLGELNRINRENAARQQKERV